MNDELMTLLRDNYPNLYAMVGGNIDRWDGDALDELRKLLEERERAAELRMRERCRVVVLAERITCPREYDRLLNECADNIHGLAPGTDPQPTPTTEDPTDEV
jgi:hypothetical protein